MSRLLVAVLVSLSLSACANETPPSLTPGTSGPKRRTATGDGLGGLGGLQSACEKAGARFRDHKRECECPSLQFKEEEGQIFSTIDGGSCLSLGRPVPWSHDPECQGEEAFKEAYLRDGITGLNKCLRGLATLRGTHFGIQLAEETSAKDALKIARRMDKEGYKLFAKLWPTPDSYFFNSTVIYYAGPVKLDRAAVEALIHPPSIQEKGRYRLFFVEPEASQVLESLGHPLDPPKPLTEPNPQLFSWAYLVKKAYDRSSAENLSGEIIVGGDCRKHCQVGRVLFEENGLKVIREKRYLVGVPYRDTIRFETYTGEVAGILQLNLRGSFSTMTKIDREITDDKVQARVRVYDRLWNLVGDETFNILENISQHRELSRRVKESQEEPGGIVMCEAADLKALQSRNLLGRLRRLQDAGKEENWFGWLPNPEKNYSRMVSPLMELHEGILPSLGSPEHGVSIAGTLMSGASPEQLSLIPISMPSCLKEFSTWSPVTRQAKVAVVNFSGSYPLEPDWCETFFPVKEIFNENARELWVTAAGNGGVANPSERCPQALGIRPNLIVVAGGTEWGLWRDSDYGVDYADLAADVYSAGRNGEQGTSYAAPRVSAVAAEIARKFPKLTVENIRLALLASVSYPTGRPLEVRSGGALNHTRALKFAEKLQAFTGKIGRTTLFMLWSEEFGKEEALARVAIWEDRGLFL